MPRKPCRKPSSRSGTAPAASRPGGAARQGWLISIARNQAIDLLRPRRAPARDISEMFDLADPGPTPEASAVGPDDRRRIEDCLGALPPRPGAGGARRLCRGLELRRAGAALRGAAQHHADLAAPGAHQPQGVPRAMSDATAPAGSAGRSRHRAGRRVCAAPARARGDRRLRRARGARSGLRGAGRGLAGRSRSVRRRLHAAGAAGGPGEADHRAALRRRAVAPSPGSGAAPGCGGRSPRRR